METIVRNGVHATDQQQFRVIKTLENVYVNQIILDLLVPVLINLPCATPLYLTAIMARINQELASAKKVTQIMRMVVKV